MAELIYIGGKPYRKFIPFPRPVRDGTVRCFACGQIDEPAYHDYGLCLATGGVRLPQRPTTAAPDSQSPSSDDANVRNKNQ